MSHTPFSLQTDLDALRAAHLYRERRVVQAWRGDGGTVAVVEGRERVVFCSNDYLGLARHPRVIEAFQRAASLWGVGSGASHLVTGHSQAHHLLEEALAAFTGRERALLFSTGYMANLGVVSALLGRGDVVLEDRLNHASLLDAGMLSGARFVRYRHGDAGQAGEKLIDACAGQPRKALVVTDGVFSMDGDVAPLQALAAVARRQGAWLMVDDAHGIGVLGTRGRGSVEMAALRSADAPVLMGTFGKALGTCGAFVAGDRALIELLVQRARSFIYTTAMPPAIAAATHAALELVDEEAWRREVVAAHVRRFRQAMQALNLPLADSATPIQPVMLGSAERAMAVSEALWARDLWVAAIRPPTVPEGGARLRITFSAAHTEAQVEQLITALSELAPQLGAT